MNGTNCQAVIDAALEASIDSQDDSYDFHQLSVPDMNDLVRFTARKNNTDEETAEAFINTRFKPARRRYTLRLLQGYGKFLYILLIIPLPVFVVTAISLFTPILLEPGETATTVVLVILYVLEVILLILMFRRKKLTSHRAAMKIWKMRNELPGGTRDALRRMDELFQLEEQRQEKAKHG